MNKSKILALGMLMQPLAIQAQKNIQQAFDALINDGKNVEVGATHKLNRDPYSGKKIGQLDVYEFAMPIKKQGLVKNIEQAFNQDKEQAYSVSTAKPKYKSNYQYEQLAVGGASGYMLGEIQGSSYIYALFLDPDDAERNHRYAYAMEWVENDNEIVGKLVVSYAPRQQSTQNRWQGSTVTVNGKNLTMSGIGNSPYTTSFGNSDNQKSETEVWSENQRSKPETWFTLFNIYKNYFIDNVGGMSASSYASMIYSLCKDSKALNAEEVKLVTSELDKLKKKTNDEFIQQLFDMSIEQLEKAK